MIHSTEKILKIVSFDSFLIIDDQSFYKTGDKRASNLRKFFSKFSQL